MIPSADEIKSLWPYLTESEQRELESLLFVTGSEFRSKYRYAPRQFVHDCIEFESGDAPTQYQDEILDAIIIHRRVCVRGPHGLGKTAMSAWIILWFVLTRDTDTDWKVITTAGAWRQLIKFLWPELHKWTRRLRWDIIGRPPLDLRTELLSLSLKGQTGEAFAVASNTPELIEGAHAKSLLYMYDESKAISDKTFDAAEGAFSNAGEDTKFEAFALAFSTPGEPNGRFYDIQSRKPGFEDWFVRAVTLDECITAGRVSREWVEQRRKQWGEGSATFQNRVLGQFASNDESGVIPLSWIEQAVERWNDWNDAGRPGALTSVGADIAESGEDSTVFAKIYDDKFVDRLVRYSKSDLMETATRLGAFGDSVPLIVDVIGVGAGVVSRLRQLKKNVVAFHAAERSEATDSSGELSFINKRAAAWWRLRELLDPENKTGVALPDDDLLTGDLTAPTWKEQSGKIQIEGKPDIKKRLGRSTDSGDAVVMAFYKTKQKKKVRAL